MGPYIKCATRLKLKCATRPILGAVSADVPVVLLNEQSELIVMAKDLKLDGIAAELEDQMSNPVIFNGMKFEERIKKCLESQKAEDLSKTFEKLYRKSKLPRKIYLSQIASSMPKGLLPEKLALLAETNYIKQGVNIVITGATGVGEYLMHEDLPIRTKGSGCF